MKPIRARRGAPDPAQGQLFTAPVRSPRAGAAPPPGGQADPYDAAALAREAAQWRQVAAERLAPAELAALDQGTLLFRGAPRQEEHARDYWRRIAHYRPCGRP